MTHEYEHQPTPHDLRMADEAARDMKGGNCPQRPPDSAPAGLSDKNDPK